MIAFKRCQGTVPFGAGSMAESGDMFFGETKNESNVMSGCISGCVGKFGNGDWKCLVGPLQGEA